MTIPAERRWQAAYLGREDDRTGHGAVRHVGDYKYDPDAEDGNQGLPASLWQHPGWYPFFIEYDQLTGDAEWWPGVMAGPIPKFPKGAPWRVDGLAHCVSRLDMAELCNQWLQDNW